jgi:hypothetical protein
VNTITGARFVWNFAATTQTVCNCSPPDIDWTATSPTTYLAILTGRNCYSGVGNGSDAEISLLIT